MNFCDFFLCHAKERQKHKFCQDKSIQKKNNDKKNNIKNCVNYVQNKYIGDSGLFHWLID